jgi:uncharacterized protein (TIGR02001 family)
VKKHIFAAVLLGALSTPALATEVTGNAGFVTNYLFRGVDVSDGKAAAQAGLDLTAGLFYAGVWASTIEVANLVEACTNALCTETADVKENEASGLELDLYLGLAGDVGDFNWGVGATLYEYTDNTIDPFVEANLSAGWKWLSVSINPGKFLSDDRDTVSNIKKDQEYVFYDLTIELSGFYGKLGYWDWDKISGLPDDEQIPSAGYGELGYASTLSWEGKDLFDYSISYVYAEPDLVVNEQSRNTLIFGITKNFGIYDK